MSVHYFVSFNDQLYTVVVFFTPHNSQYSPAQGVTPPHELHFVLSVVPHVEQKTM